MKRVWKRTLAMLLVVVMVGGLAPLESIAKIDLSWISDWFAYKVAAFSIAHTPEEETGDETSCCIACDMVNEPVFAEETEPELQRSKLNIAGESTPRPKRAAKAASSNSTYTVLLLDVEASHVLLYNNEPLCTLGSPAEDVRMAALRLVDQIRLTKGTTNVAIVTFSSTASTVQGFTSSYKTLVNAISSINSGSSWANINDAYLQADTLLQSVDASATKNIVLFSQGLPYAGAYSSTGRYSSSDCSWLRTDNGIYTYQYANVAYSTARSLMGKYNLYSIGVYQSFDIVPAEGQGLLRFAKQFNMDVQNCGYYDLSSSSELEFLFVKEVFNLPYESDPDAIKFPVSVMDSNGKTVPAKGAIVTVYSGKKDVLSKPVESDGYVRFSKRELANKGYNERALKKCTVSAHFSRCGIVLCSETVQSNGEWTGDSLLTCKSLMCDEPRQYFDLSVAYSGADKNNKKYQEICRVMCQFGKDLAQMSNGHAILSNVSVQNVSDDATLYSEDSNGNIIRDTPADILVFENDTHPVSTVYLEKSQQPYFVSPGIDCTNGHIKLSLNHFDSKTLTHEAGHYLFGFADEYCYGKLYYYDTDIDGITCGFDCGHKGTSADPHTDEKNSGYWSTQPGKAYRGRVDRPKGMEWFGVMEDEDVNLEMSTDSSYSYLSSSTVNYSKPEMYTPQFYLNGESCESGLKSYFEKKLEYYNRIKYTDTKGKQQTAEYWYAVPTIVPSSKKNRTRMTNIDYSSYDESNSCIAEINFQLVENNLSINIDEKDDSTLVFLKSISDQTTQQIESSDVRIYLDDLKDNNYVLVVADTTKELKNTYYIQGINAIDSNELKIINNSGDLAVLVTDCVTRIIGDFTSQGKNYTLLCASDSLEGRIEQSVVYNPSFALDSYTWARIVDGDIYPVESVKNTEEHGIDHVSTYITGFGTYGIFAQSSSGNNNPLLNFQVSQNGTTYDNQLQLSFDDPNPDTYLYRVYYDTKSNHNESGTFQNQRTYPANGGNYYLSVSDGYELYRIAVQAISLSGAESDLAFIDYQLNPKDSDEDGIPDYWLDDYPELSLLDDIPYDDPDDDGLDNLTEYEYGTDPLNPDTDGDNVYDKIELLKDLDPLEAKTDGETDDYIRAYGQPDLELTEIHCDDEYMYFSVKNDTDGMAMRSVVEVGSGEDSIALWTVNIDAHSIIDFAVKKEDLADVGSFQITADAGEITHDSDYMNNSFSYSAEQSIRLDDIDIVKNTSASLLPDDQESVNDIYHWEIVSGSSITLNDRTGEITANKIGRSQVKVETLSGVSKNVQISVVSFEGAEFTVFESRKINNNAEIAITGYFGEDTEASIPETIGGLPVTTINSNAFQNSVAERVVLPETISTIAAQAFFNNNTIAEYIAAADSDSFSSEDGILYSKDKTKIVAYPPAKVGTSFTTPDFVQEIGTYAFADNLMLEEMVIGEVSTIGKYAFVRCPELKKVSFGNEIERVESCAFLDCSALEEVHYSGSLNEWCGISFANASANPNYFASNLMMNGNKVEGALTLSADIGNFSLYNCKGITGIQVSDSVNTIGKNAFMGCTNLSDVSVSDHVGSIGAGAFQDCESISTMSLPFVGESRTAAAQKGVFGYIFGYGSGDNGGKTEQYYLDSSGTEHSYFCFVPQTITSVAITDAQSVSYCAFSNCSFIKHIEIYDAAEAVGERAFAGCDGLESLTLPFIGSSRTATGEEGVLGYYFNTAEASTEDTTTQYYAASASRFYYIPSGLEFVTITDATQLSYGAFYNCSKLKTIGLNKELTSIAAAAFSGCSALESVHYAGTMEDWCAIDFVAATSTPCNYATSISINGEIVEDILTIPNGLTEIKPYTFYGFNTVSALSFPEGINAIGNRAFGKCSSLSYVDIPDTVASMGTGVFINCTMLESISLPNSITAILTDTFYKCSSLTAIDIPDTVTNIGRYAFEDCSSLKTVVLPASLIKSDRDAFRDCDAVETVKFNGDIYGWCAVEFVNAYSTPMLRTSDLYIGGQRIGEDLEIPADITSIGSYVFFGCTDLQNVYYGGSLNDWCQITFGSGTAANPCHYAQHLYTNNELISGAITISTSISPRALLGVSDITNITLTSDVTTIGASAFSNCTGLESIIIPNSVTSIGNSAFNNCSALKSISIPGSTASLGSSVFNNCSQLETVEIQEGATSLGSSFFSGCSALKAAIIPKSVTSIGSFTFYNCSSLESITIPFVGTSKDATGTNQTFGAIFGSTSSSTAEGVTQQFYDSSNSYYYYIPASLRSVTVTNASSIPYGAFYNCANLKSISLPDSVSSMGEKALYGCTGLESITLPFVGTNRNATGYSSTFGYVFGYSSTSIDGYTQQYYDSSNSYYYNIPSTITTVEITDQNYLPYGAFFGCKNIKDIVFSNKVKGIGVNAFSGCSVLENIHYSGTLEDWRDTDFGNATSHPNYFAKHFYLNGSRLEGDLIIPESWITIPTYLFYNFADITSVSFGTNLANIDSYAFGNCASLNSVQYTGTFEDWYDIVFANYAANPNYYAKNLLINGEPLTGMISIPDTKETVPCAVLAGCTEIEGVQIPDSVTELGAYCFTNCTSLSDVTIPDTVTSIGEYSFEGCFGLTTFVIPKGVTSIGSYAFRRCTSLTTLYYNAENCSNAGKNISSIITIRYPAFSGCASLENVILGDTVCKVPGLLLYNNSSVKKVIIPDSVTSIGSRAFYGCSSLTDIYYMNAEEKWNEITIASNNPILDTVTMHFRKSGDISGDGSIDLKDVTVFTRFLAGGWNVEIEEFNADVNRDGEVNLKDVVLIRRFLAGGWDVELL